MSDAADTVTERPADSGEERVFLVVVDDSEEMPVALRFACLRARRNGDRIALLYVTERADFQHWASVGDLMRQEAREEGEQLLHFRAEIHHQILVAQAQEAGVPRILSGGAVAFAPHPVIAEILVGAARVPAADYRPGVATQVDDEEPRPGRPRQPVRPETPLPRRGVVLSQAAFHAGQGRQRFRRGQRMPGAPAGDGLLGLQLAARINRGLGLCHAGSMRRSPRRRKARGR